MNTKATDAAAAHCKQSRHMCLMLPLKPRGSKMWAGYLAASSADKQPSGTPKNTQLEQVRCV